LNLLQGKILQLADACKQF